MRSVCIRTLICSYNPIAVHMCRPITMKCCDFNQDCFSTLFFNFEVGILNFIHRYNTK